MNVDFLINFIKESNAKKKPFLAYHTCLLPHYPWVPTPDSDDKNYTLTDNAGKGDPKYFPDMVAYLDKCLGRLMQCLEDEGIADNTIVIFLSDNGTDQDLSNLWGDNKLKIKGGKGSLTDLGTRVPLIVRWPGKVKAGTTCGDLIDFSDLLPTLCELTGSPLPDQEIHGRSFAPQLLGKASNPRDWVHIQNQEGRYIRSHTYFYNQSGKLYPVTKFGTKEPVSNREPEEEARNELKSAYESLK